MTRSPARLALLALPVILALAAPLQAQEARGWRPGAVRDAPDGREANATYVSPGLLSWDHAGAGFYWGGGVPRALFDPRNRGAALNYLQTEAPDLAEGCTDANCAIGSLYDTGHIRFSFLVDLSDSDLERDPLARLSAFGLRTSQGGFAPLVNLGRGALCSGDEGESICATCYDSGPALAAQGEGRRCGTPEAQNSGLVAVDAGLSYAAFAARVSAADATIGRDKFVLRFIRRSGKTYDFTYDSVGFVEALFGDR